MLTCAALVMIGMGQMVMAEAEECADEWIQEAETSISYEGAPTLKVRIGAFFPTSDRFTEIYGDSLPVYEIEGAWTFCQCYKAWVNIDYFCKKGHSHHLDYFTSVKMSNFSFGITIPHRIFDQFTVYAGIGPSIGYIAVHNRVTKKHINEKQAAFGLVLKSGITYEITSCYFADFFVDYLYQPSTFKTRVNMGGVKVGLGLGSHF